MSKRPAATRAMATRGAAALWIVLVLAVLLWQTLFYRGAVARLAEWQFGSLGGYFSVATVVVVALLLALPAILLLRPAPVSLEGEGEIAVADTIGVRRARRFGWLLAGAALLSALVAGYELWLGTSIVRQAGMLRSLSAGAPPPADFRDGRAELTGRVLYGRRVVVGSRLWLHHTGASFAPVVAADGRGGTLTYFVEVDERMRTPGPVTLSGMLVRDGLRPDALRLFETIGYRVARPHYALYLRESTLLRGYKTAAAKLGLLALVLGLLAAYQWRRIRRMRPKRAGVAHMTN